jgi:flagellar basal body rod protein FlgF
MKNSALNTGQSDQFDDLIMDPEGASESQDLGQNSQGYDSSDEGEEDSSKNEEQSSEELESFDNLDPDSQLKQLDDKEDEEEKQEKEEKEEKEEKKEDENKEEEKDKPSDEEKKEEAPKGKTLKMFQDGKKYEVPLEATVKVKVDGKWEKIPVSELRDNYSGTKAWTQEIEQAKSKTRELEAKEEELTRVQTTIKETLTSTKESLVKAINEGGSPLDAVNKIVDMLKVDSYDFNKALFDSLSEELVLLDQMDETERKAYWLEKKTTHLEKNHESLTKMQQQTQAREERIARVDQLRVANGVSEDDFVSAYNELSQSGEEVAPEKVIQYAASLPFVESAEELLAPYEDQFSDDEFEDMMSKVANTLKTNKDVTKEDMATWLAENYVVEDIINEANTKAEKIGAGMDQREQKPQAISQHDIYRNPTYESFDDF